MSLRGVLPLPTPPLRLSRRVSIALAVLLSAAVLVGLRFDELTRAPSVAAQPTCGSQNCGGGVAYSALDVNHTYTSGMNVHPVEPDDTDTFDVEVRYLGLYDMFNPTCSCKEVLENVSVSVTWTGSGWSASCTGCNAMAGPVYGVTVCDRASCGSLSHGWGYRLQVQIDDSVLVCTGGLQNPGFLNQVTYTADTIDDGHVIDTSGCLEGASVVWVSPVVVQATDSGPFECASSCNNTGASLTLTYQ